MPHPCPPPAYRRREKRPHRNWQASTTENAEKEGARPKLALLINFNVRKLKDGVKRIALR
jgi:hypothetical protein